MVDMENNKINLNQLREPKEELGKYMCGQIAAVRGIWHVAQ